MSTDNQELIIILSELSRDDSDTGPTVAREDNKYFEAYEQLLDLTDIDTTAFFEPKSNPINIFFTIFMNNLQISINTINYIGKNGYLGLNLILKLLLNRGFKLHSLKLGLLSSVDVKDSLLFLLQQEINTYNLILANPEIQQQQIYNNYLHSTINYITEFHNLINDRWNSEVESMQSGDELPHYPEIPLQALIANFQPVIMNNNSGADHQ